MSTTQLQLRTRVRALLSEAAAGTWTDAVLDGYINDSELALWMDLAESNPSFGLREAYAQMTQAQTDYAYPTDILGRNIRALFAYQTATSAEWCKVDQASFEEVIQEGETQTVYPYKYVPLDGFFKIGPPPDASGWYLRIVYVRKPTAMTVASDSETMDSDDNMAECIAVGAAIRALEVTGVDYTFLEKRQVKAMNQVLGAIQENEPRYARLAWKY